MDEYDDGKQKRNALVTIVKHEVQRRKSSFNDVYYILLKCTNFTIFFSFRVKRELWIWFRKREQRFIVIKNDNIVASNKWCWRTDFNVSINRRSILKHFSPCILIKCSQPIAIISQNYKLLLMKNDQINPLSLIFNLHLSRG